MPYPAEFAAIVPIIKKILKERSITYKELAKRLHMSEANVKKIMGAKDCSLRRLNQICEVLDFSVFDLLEVLRSRPIPKVVLNSAQQAFLVDDELALLLYFKIVFEGVPPLRAKKELGLSDTAFEKRVRGLEKNGLLKKSAGGKMVGPDEHIGLWPHDGPLAKVVREKWTHSVLEAAIADYQNERQDLSVRGFALSEKSIAEFRARALELLNDFERISLLEAKVTSTRNVSCLFAFVPESLSILRHKKR